MANDPLFTPFKDKPSTNPRYEALSIILGREMTSFGPMMIATVGRRA